MANFIQEKANFTMKITSLQLFLRRNSKNCSKNVCYYNTAIVFNKSGQIVEKYDKYHVYEGPLIDTPYSAEPITFEMDSGVRFGLMICFDINYLQPAYELLKKNVDAIIFQAAWTDELPFLTGLEL